MSKPKVLIVDDCPINLMALSRVLNRSDFCCEQANSAMEAFQMISDKSFSLILMDIEMPEINGLEATRFIRQLHSEYFRALPIIALTASNNREIEKLARNAKMDDLITKPIDPDSFIARIQALINNKNALALLEACY